MGKEIRTVPNQRILQIHKEPTNKQNKYTTNNLEALDQAVYRLQSKAGFKLYMYLAKNQDKYEFALSSAHFIAWSGVGMSAYNSAFEELVEEGYLVKKDENSNRYIFYDKSSKPNKAGSKDVIIEIPEEKPKNFIF